MLADCDLRSGKNNGFATGFIRATHPATFFMGMTGFDRYGCIADIDLSKTITDKVIPMFNQESRIAA